MTMHVLFVCGKNGLRSPTAEQVPAARRYQARVGHLLLLAVLLVGCAEAEPAPAADEPSNPGQPLESADMTGAWQATYEVTRSEKTRVVFMEDGSVTLTREMPGSPVQHLVAAADKVTVVDDIDVVSFEVYGELAYKLVLSGWKTQHSRRIFGTLYMYVDGALFNGLPASFAHTKNGS